MKNLVPVVSFRFRWFLFLFLAGFSLAATLPISDPNRVLTAEERIILEKNIEQIPVALLPSITGVEIVAGKPMLSIRDTAGRKFLIQMPTAADRVGQQPIMFARYLMAYFVPANLYQTVMTPLERQMYEQWALSLYGGSLPASAVFEKRFASWYPRMENAINDLQYSNRRFGEQTVDTALKEALYLAAMSRSDSKTATWYNLDDSSDSTRGVLLERTDVSVLFSAKSITIGNYSVELKEVKRGTGRSQTTETFITAVLKDGVYLYRNLAIRLESEFLERWKMPPGQILEQQSRFAEDHETVPGRNGSYPLRPSHDAEKKFITLSNPSRYRPLTARRAQEDLSAVQDAIRNGTMGRIPVGTSHQD